LKKHRDLDTQPPAAGAVCAPLVYLARVTRFGDELSAVDLLFLGCERISLTYRLGARGLVAIRFCPEPAVAELSMTTVLWYSAEYSVATIASKDTASGSYSLTGKIGCLNQLCDVLIG